MARHNVGAFFMIFKLGSKFGAKILAAIPKLLKGLKFGKVALAGGSAVAYTWLFSWQFAAMLMLALAVHESGHIWAMKRCGLRTKGIYFIPFFGAMAVSESSFQSRGAEAFIAIMGPIWGLALALLVAGVFLATGHHLFAAGAAWMAMINLFNLLPVNPLDGGRMMKSVAFSISSILGIVVLGLGLLLALVLCFYNGIFLFAILLLIGAGEVLTEWNRWRKFRTAPVPATALGPDVAPNPAPAVEVDPKVKLYHMPRMDRRTLVLAIASYLVVAGLLWGLMSLTSHVPDASGASDVFK